MRLQRDLVQTYFTPAPYYLYKEASRMGNMAYAGIGLGLINSQTIFWVANIGTAVCFYYNLMNILLISFLMYLYYHSISKSIYLLSLFIKD
jgi:aspartyl/asparaginyl-tRNA synthetase